MLYSPSKKMNPTVSMPQLKVASESVLMRNRSHRTNMSGFMMSDNIFLKKLTDRNQSQNTHDYMDSPK